MALQSSVSSNLHKAIEGRDVDLLLSLYDDNAELRVIDRNHPPSSPLEMRGKQAISQYFTDILQRDMTHKVQDEVIGDNKMSFTDSCQYPDGTKVFSSSTLEFRNGKIVREVEVQEWDG